MHGTPRKGSRYQCHHIEGLQGKVIELALAAVRLQRLSQIQPKQAKDLHDEGSSGHVARNGTTLGNVAILIGLLILYLTANPASADDAQAWLDAHNAYRAKHCVSALKWSAVVAASAKEWADACKPGHAEQDTYGENLFRGTPDSYSIQFVVKNWYDEIDKYNFAAPGYSEGIGHFTQVVWRGSTELGCAKALCAGGLEHFVCRYSPHGNVAGQFPQNVPEPGCIESVPKPPPGFNPGHPPPIQSVPKPPAGADIFKKMKP